MDLLLFLTHRENYIRYRSRYTSKMDDFSVLNCNVQIEKTALIIIFHMFESCFLFLFRRFESYISFIYKQNKRCVSCNVCGVCTSMRVIQQMFAEQFERVTNKYSNIQEKKIKNSKEFLFCLL